MIRAKVHICNLSFPAKFTLHYIIVIRHSIVINEANFDKEHFANLCKLFIPLLCLYVQQIHTTAITIVNGSIVSNKQWCQKATDKGYPLAGFIQNWLLLVNFSNLIPSESFICSWSCCSGKFFRSPGSFFKHWAFMTCTWIHPNWAIFDWKIELKRENRHLLVMNFWKGPRPKWELKLMTCFKFGLHIPTYIWSVNCASPRTFWSPVIIPCKQQWYQPQKVERSKADGDLEISPPGKNYTPFFVLRKHPFLPTGNTFICIFMGLKMIFLSPPNKWC